MTVHSTYCLVLEEDLELKEIQEAGRPNSWQQEKHTKQSDLLVA